MAINISVYSNANSASQTMTVDFVGDVLAATDSNNTSMEYYFKITTGARQDNNVAFPIKIVRDLGEIALNKTKQSASNTAADYTNIDAMVTDYCYDFINGHTADQFSSGCTLQRPVKFR
jgi:hypothetical protein